ncbi:MAG: hypothetical protein K8R48_06605 [Alphaproteobacteria bacterium]|nr:hypothetical protein [Alphaproteobacteria bacterium]
MKKYLTLAAILGAIAFISVSYLAQAEPKDATAPAAAMAPATAPVSAADAYAADLDMCKTMTSAPTDSAAAAPSEEAQKAAFKKCMNDKGHNDDEIKAADEKAAADKKAADEKAAAPAEAPKADAPAAK